MRCSLVAELFPATGDTAPLGLRNSWNLILLLILLNMKKASRGPQTAGAVPFPADVFAVAHHGAWTKRCRSEEGADPWGGTLRPRKKTEKKSGLAKHLRCRIHTRSSFVFCTCVYSKKGGGDPLDQTNA